MKNNNPPKNAWGTVAKPVAKPVATPPQASKKVAKQNAWGLGSTSARNTASTGMSPVEFPSLSASSSKPKPKVTISDKPQEVPSRIVPATKQTGVKEPAIIKEPEKNEVVQLEKEEEEAEPEFKGTPMDIIRQKMGLVYVSAP